MGTEGASARRAGARVKLSGIKDPARPHPWKDPLSIPSRRAGTEGATLATAGGISQVIHDRGHAAVIMQRALFAIPAYDH
jgi:hypothetical protein